MRAAKRQSGAGLILMFLALVLMAVSVLALKFNVAERRAETNQRTQLALTRARQLLLAYAARPHGRESDSAAETRELQLARPGELQCPDYNNDGIMSGPANDYAGADCRRKVGWFSFESFDAQDIVDSNTHALWFAVADGFFNRSGLAGYSEPVLNTSVVPTLTLDGKPMAAILIATGEPLDGQNQRNINDAALAQSSFLDQENAATEDSFVSQSASGPFNDIVVGITPAEHFHAVELSAAHAIARRLNNYFLDNGAYPYAADALGVCDEVTFSSVGDVPLSCSGVSTTAPTLPFPLPTATDAFDVWLVRNDWPAQFTYERIAGNHIRLSSRYADSRMRPIEFVDAKKLRL